MFNPTVYIVDDCSINHLFLKMFLNETKVDFHLRAFLDPEMGIKQLLAEAKPCLIILDINMPNLNGWDFLNVLKSHSVYHPVVVASSSNTVDDMQHLKLHQKVVSYIQKPFNRNRIVRILKEQLLLLGKNEILIAKS
ncbi:MAG: response regulator [Flavobacteriaceae bacterium]|nr:response regulator [Flavobacteriaceae bacterium]